MFIIPLAVNTTWKRIPLKPFLLELEQQQVKAKIHGILVFIVWRPSFEMRIKCYSLGKQVFPQPTGMLGGRFKGKTKVTPQLSLHM